MADTIAFCWASGLIQFGDQVPDGAIEIARGDDQVVREIIEVTSRHAYDGKSLLVPGIHPGPGPAGSARLPCAGGVKCSSPTPSITPDRATAP